MDAYLDWAIARIRQRQLINKGHQYLTWILESLGSNKQHPAYIGVSVSWKLASTTSGSCDRCSTEAMSASQLI